LARGLPQKLDDDTVWERFELAGASRARYWFRSQTPLANLDVHVISSQLGGNVRRALCQSPTMQLFREFDVQVEYVFLSKEGTEVGRASAEPGTGVGQALDGAVLLQVAASQTKAATARPPAA